MISDETREELLYLFDMKCPICGQPFKNNEKVDIHHTVLHNTKANREKFPCFIDSLFNLTPVHRHCHDANPSWGDRFKEDLDEACLLESVLKAFAELSQYTYVYDKRLKMLMSELMKIRTKFK